MTARKLILCIIDGLTPAALEQELAGGTVPTLGALADRGRYVHGVSTFPSVTPVCLSAIATGGGPELHGIPHLAWYHRGERRLVEYGSSFAAVRASGLRFALRDSVIEMSRSHLASGATTVFEALEDAGLVTASVNFTCYRGRQRHVVRLPRALRQNRWFESVDGPTRFFFFNLWESERVGAPLAVRSRTAGSVDRYAAAVGRWLVTRDGFDFLVYYLPDFDYASHALGPLGAGPALRQADRCLASLVDAAGDLDSLLERYALVVCADHGQTAVERTARLEDAFSDLRLLHPRRSGSRAGELAVAASNRAALLYRLDGCPLTARELAERLDGEPSVDVALFREDGAAVARRGASELRFARAGDGFRLAGDASVLDPARYPDGLDRAWGALACRAAGDVVLSAAEGWEFADVGGGHHRGGGSHGSLLAGDSLVPMLFVGVEDEVLPARRPRITDLKALALAQLGVARPAALPEAVRVR
ncbi:MAG: alkaline phosphatase family protein [Gaiellales bacterium]